MKLFLKAAFFTVLAPGMYAGLVPWLLVGDQRAGGGWLMGSAILLLGLGAFIYLRCVWDFATYGKGIPVPIDPPKRLVMRSFYSYSRNPMYVATLAMIAGWALLFGSAVLVGYWIVLFVVFSLVVRFYEEPHLTREFGDEYRAYQAAVGRWFPRPHRGEAEDSR